MHIHGGGVQISTLDENGDSKFISNGTGLGVKQHDQVMLQYGYTNKVQKKSIEIPSGDYACITLEVPSGLNHHAEFRVISAYNSECEFALVPNYTGTLPAIVQTLTVWNEQGPTINNSALSVFAYRGVQSANPIDFVPTDQTTPEYMVLRATSGQGIRVASSDGDASVQGRYYYPGIHVVRIKNTGSADAVFDYTYQWHEF